MNKVYTIGRDKSCDIIIQDDTDVVSRIHATLKPAGKGKYTLVDQSRNGTYVNGIRMAASEEIPVTRKDVISFAHVQDLDWRQIPEEKLTGKAKLIICLLCLAVIGALVYGVFHAPRLVQKPQATPAETMKPQPAKVIKRDTVEIRDTIYFKPKPEPDKKKKPEDKDKNKKKDKQPEEEVVNPLY